jgi:hypothetical protein
MVKLCVRRSLTGLAGVLALAAVMGVPVGMAGAVTQSSASAAAMYCDAGDVCLFDHTGLRGLVAAPPGNLGRRYSLIGYGAQDKTSSWRNRSTYRWCAYDERTFLPDEYLFTLDPGKYNSWVGSYANDRTDYIEPCA